MKLFTASQIKRWDRFTIDCEPISSLLLMERAAESFTHWFTTNHRYFSHPILIFCGNGNNGGDGLAIGRILRDKCYDVKIFINKFAPEDSADFVENLNIIRRLGDISLEYLSGSFPEIPSNSIIIDALLGIGTNRPLDGYLADLVSYINTVENHKIISIDVPSGLSADLLIHGYAVKANVVFTFQVPKLSFFYKENAPFIQKFVIGNINLDQGFLQVESSKYIYLTKEYVGTIYKQRTDFQHKGDFGHVMIIAGKEGSMGAAVLSCKAALKIGSGLVTAAVPEIGRDILQISVPEAMVVKSGDTQFDTHFNLVANSYTIGCGPGLGSDDETQKALFKLLQSEEKPMVLDADALNIISKDKFFWEVIPKFSILTPHPKEFERLFGSSTDSQKMFEKQLEMAVFHQVIIVLKGAYTRICTPDGLVYINSTGNSGMATAGSGDVLTGMITGLLAQKYLPQHAAILGVFIHGLSGDLALKNESKESLIASDIIVNIGAAFKSLEMI